MKGGISKRGGFGTQRSGKEFEVGEISSWD